MRFSVVSYSCCLLVAVVSCVPVAERIRDSEIVQSVIREVRAAPDHLEQLVNPDTKAAFLHKYSDKDAADDDDESGYEKRVEDDGAKGYKHYDSYHKKGGDKYGYEAKAAYGKSKGDLKDGGGKSSKYEEAYDEGDDVEKDTTNDKPNKKKIVVKDESETDDNGEGAEEGEEETKNTYKVVEDVDEDDDSGAYSGSYTNYNNDDEEDSGQYNEEGDDDGGSAGHYTEEGAAAPLEEYYDEDDGGSSGHYTADGSNTYDDGEHESEHYTAADHDDYDY